MDMLPKYFHVIYLPAFRLYSERALVRKLKTLLFNLKTLHCSRYMIQKKIDRSFVIFLNINFSRIQ